VNCGNVKKVQHEWDQALNFLKAVTGGYARAYEMPLIGSVVVGKCSVITGDHP